MQSSEPQCERSPLMFVRKPYPLTRGRGCDRETQGDRIEGVAELASEFAANGSAFRRQEAQRPRYA